MAVGKGIVVVNEYTVKNASGKASKYGNSPGDYVTDYMSRNDATETLTPVKLMQQDDYMTRYTAREAASKQVYDSSLIESVFHSCQKYGGLAFDKHNISMSDEELTKASKDMQGYFEDGKTILKTVISFDEEYLRKNKIIPEDFTCNYKGDYMGKIDHLKLRMGLMNGLSKIADDYDDLQYVGVIQTDTMHVHCHLAMVDRGEGKITADGTQKGKLSRIQMEKIKRGVDLYLNEYKSVQHMSSNINMDKRNTSMYVKRVSYQTMQKNGMAQLLIASLPEDKRLWRASCNVKEMSKANALVRSYVREIFAQPESGYHNVQSHIIRNANARQDRENLSDEAYQELIRAGERRVEDTCVNSVYNMLRNIAKQDKQTHTPTLDRFMTPIHNISKNEDDLGEFTFKLRSYSTRLGHHTKKRDEAHSVTESYAAALANHQVSEDAKPVYDFFKNEEDYNEMLMCKYQHFLHFLPLSDKYREEIEEFLKYKKNLYSLEGMYNDGSIKRMTSKHADEYAERVYGVQGGRYMTFEPDLIKSKIEAMKADLLQRDKEFAYKLTADGLIADTAEDGGITLKSHLKYDFNDVKALDLHHMGYDSATDMRVSNNNADVFIKAARRRQELAQGAVDYLVLTGQSSELANIDLYDIRIMNKTADKLDKKPEIVSERADERQQPLAVKTVRLSRNFDLSVPIQQSLAEMQAEEEEDNSILGRKAQMDIY